MISYFGLEPFFELTDQSFVKLRLEDFHLLDDAVQLAEVEELAVAVSVEVEAYVEVVGLVAWNNCQVDRRQWKQLRLLNAGLDVGGLDEDVPIGILAIGESPKLEVQLVDDDESSSL